MLDNTPNQPTKFRTKRQIKFKVSMLRSSLCDYSDAYILISGTITITGAGEDDDDAKRLDEKNKAVIFTNCDHSLTA